MLHFFRNMFKSKLGLALVMAFIALIGIAFATADVSSTMTGGGISGSDKVAVVGKRRISTADLAQAANSALDRARQDNPSITMEEFVAQGGLNDTLDQLIDRSALQEFARAHGLRAGDNLVNSEIRQLPAFRGADGNFSEDAFRLALAQNGISEAQLREDITTALLARQLLLPASVGARVPDALALRYAQLFKERRKGGVATLSAAAFAPNAAPTAAQLKAYYDLNRSAFVRPERRVVRYATFDATNLGSSIEPTAAEIAARYKRDAALYAASETRSLTQLILPTQAGAAAIRAKVAAGTSLEAAAAATGLRAAPVGDLTKAKARGQFSAAVADAYFAAPRGGLTDPVRSPLGWHVARVDAVDATPARTLAQATPAITEQLRDEKRATGLADLASRVEGLFDDGATFAEVTRELKLTANATKPVVANGLVYNGNGERAPEIIVPAIKSAFQMDEDEPEVATLPEGAGYLIYDVGAITPAVTAPLAEIGPQVAAAWKLAEGYKAAGVAADAVLAATAKGATLEQALAARKIAGRVERFDLTREDLTKVGGQRVPPGLALMFAMAQGTAKKLAVGGRQGWSVVTLDSIVVDPIAPSDPLVGQARSQLGEIFGNEYAEQLRDALRKAVGVERNEDAIQALRKQLLGGT